MQANEDNCDVSGNSQSKTIEKKNKIYNLVFEEDEVVGQSSGKL